jgi:hypothetical protein
MDFVSCLEFRAEHHFSEIVSLSVCRCIGGEKYKYTNPCMEATLLFVMLDSGEHPENM